MFFWVVDLILPITMLLLALFYKKKHMAKYPESVDFEQSYRCNPKTIG
jgi:hypothetical protein